MKIFNKSLAGFMVLGLVMSTSGCGKASQESNTTPEITGVMDCSVQAGTEFNALEGITSMDKEDGDLTSMICIESTPELEFKGGKATPDKAGTYELTYSVTDKGGEMAKEYATLTVTKQVQEAEVYKDFDFSKEQVVDAKGWNAHIADGVQATGELKEGAYVFDITSPGQGDGDIQLVKSGMKLKAADYRIKVWAKSTANTYCHILAVDENASEWSTFGGAYNVQIGNEIQPLEMNFTSEGDGAASIMLNLGKITPNPENADDTTPENFTVTIDKIEIYEISGNEEQEPVYTCDFTSNEEAVTVEAGDGATASVEINEEAAVVTVDSYPTEGGVWSIKTNIGIGNTAIEQGNKYYYKFKVSAQNAQAGECLVESATQYDEQRANFSGFSVEAGSETIITGTFVAENAVSDPVIRLQMGNPSDGVTSNVLKIDDVEFGLVTGDLETIKTIDAFTAFGKGTANETNTDLPFATFNGTDEDNDRGVGTIYLKDGSLFYRIDQGGITDWHNKLMCGTNESPLVLEADSYYTIEITCKATKNVSCGFMLNPIGNWDPRILESMDITTEEKTFKFTTKETLITDMNFEMLFQFGSEATADLGEVTIEISDINIYKLSIAE